jgi:hypothetical protein
MSRCALAVDVRLRFQLAAGDFFKLLLSKRGRIFPPLGYGGLVNAELVGKSRLAPVVRNRLFCRHRQDSSISTLLSEGQEAR